MRIVSEALQTSTGLFMPVYFMLFEADKKDHSLLEASHLPALRQACLTKIRADAEDGRLASHPNMDVILYQWKE